MKERFPVDKVRIISKAIRNPPRPGVFRVATCLLVTSAALAAAQSENTRASGPTTQMWRDQALAGLLDQSGAEFPFKLDDKVVVQVEKGEDLGRVIHLLDQLPEERTAPEYEVLRKATPKDIKTLEEYRAREGEAKEICKEKIVKHGLAMKLVDVEYQFDGRKLIFYFTADGRIDFRQLVKDLAATFRTRIELRQIGARDEMKRFL